MGFLLNQILLVWSPVKTTPKRNQELPPPLILRGSQVCLSFKGGFPLVPLKGHHKKPATLGAEAPYTTPPLPAARAREGLGAGLRHAAGRDPQHLPRGAALLPGARGARQRRCYPTAGEKRQKTARFPSLRFGGWFQLISPFGCQTHPSHTRGSNCR